MPIAVDRTAARRYAEAFVNTMEKSGQLEKGLEELESFAGIYRGSKDAQRFLGSPEIAPEDKERVLEKVLAGSAISEVLSLLRLLLKRDRIDHLPEIYEAARAVSEERQGLMRGKVVTAHPISTSEKERLAGAVSKALGKRVVLEQYVDPRLIGGVRISVGSALLDGSVWTQLERVREQLKAVKVN